MNRTRSILIFDECVRSFPRLNMEFAVKLVEFQSDGAAPQKARLPRFPFQSSGIRVNNEPIRGPTIRVVNFWLLPDHRFTGKLPVKKI